MSNKQIIGFDADDTLWENEVFFHRAQMKFIELHPHIKNPEKVRELKASIQKAIK